MVMLIDEPRNGVMPCRWWLGEWTFACYRGSQFPIGTKTARKEARIQMRLKQQWEMAYWGKESHDWWECDDFRLVLVDRLKQSLFVQSQNVFWVDFAQQLHELFWSQNAIWVAVALPEQRNELRKELLVVSQLEIKDNLLMSKQLTENEAQVAQVSYFFKQGEVNAVSASVPFTCICFQLSMASIILFYFLALNLSLMVYG